VGGEYEAYDTGLIIFGVHCTVPIPVLPLPDADAAHTIRQHSANVVDAIRILLFTLVMFMEYTYRLPENLHNTLIRRYRTLLASITGFLQFPDHHHLVVKNTSYKYLLFLSDGPAK